MRASCSASSDTYAPAEKNNFEQGGDLNASAMLGLEAVHNQGLGFRVLGLGFRV